MAVHPVQPSRSHSRQRPAPPIPPALEFARHQARALHRDARSSALTTALPALRRLHAARVWPQLSLAALYRERHRVQRKHCLQALAHEAGERDWETCQRQLRQTPPSALLHLQVGRLWSFLSLWFADEHGAAAFAAACGGTVVRVGRQAVVLSDDARRAALQAVGA